jgi:hypothetical protein
MQGLAWLVVVALHLLAIRDIAGLHRAGDQRRADAPEPVLFARLVPRTPARVAPPPAEAEARVAREPPSSMRTPAPSSSRDIPPAVSNETIETSAPPSSAVNDAPASAAIEQAPSLMPTFEWPPSMRLSYAVRVHDGTRDVAAAATLDWLHEGDHYRIDLRLAPGTAYTLHFESEGTVTRDGLVPEHLAHERRGFDGAPGPEAGTVQFDGGGVVLVDGRRVARPDGLQDLATAIFEMARTFALHPQWLQEGRSLDMPLATLTQVARGVLDVGEPLPVDTGLGMQQAVALRWRPAPAWADESPADVWIAPSLGYLPARMTWRLSGTTRLDMTLASSP